MFLPVGHDQSSVRRLPWVTFTLMGLCVAVFLLTLSPIWSSDERASKLLNDIVKYYFEHPFTELDPEIEDYILGFVPDHQGQREAFKEVIKEGVTGFGLPPGVEGEALPSQKTEAEQQAELDRLTLLFHQAIKSSPYFAFGLVPSDQHVYAYITYQFMHGGWMHLIGNLFFLYLAGPYIEDVWGRPLFAAFYLSSGVFSALIYVMKYPLMEGPLVGASGAIAGLMGAFLVRYAGAKIKMMVWVFFFRPKFFDAPAWLMLPLWLLREVFSGQAVDFGGGQGSGVAHWAHVAGFVYGLVIAVVVRQSKFEEKFVDAAIDSRAIQHENLELEEALVDRSQGELLTAEKKMLALLQKAPGDFDVAMAYWDVRRDMGDTAPAFPHVQRVFWNSLRRGDLEVVDMRWPEVLEMAPEGAIDPALAARVVETLGDSLPEVLRQETVDAGIAGVTTSTPTGVLVRLTRAAAVIGVASARTFAQQTLAAPDLPVETKAEIEGLLAGSLASVAEVPLQGQNSAGIPEPEATSIADAVDISETPATLAIEDHQLEIMEALPTAWEEGVLTLSIRDQERPMDLRQIQAIAVGGIVEPGQTPFVVVDLMLDAPWSKRVKLRVVRLCSTAFDPSTLAAGADPMSCFRQMLVEMFAVSEAAPLPDPDAAVGSPFQRFTSVSNYEEEVIGIRSDSLV